MGKAQDPKKGGSAPGYNKAGQSPHESLGYLVPVLAPLLSP